MASKSVHSSQFTVHNKFSKFKTVNREPITVYRKGITLAELMIGGGIAAILMIVLAAFYFGQFKAFSNQTVAIDLSSQGRIAVDDISNNIRQSESVCTTSCGSLSGSTVSVLTLRLWPLVGTPGQPRNPTSSSDYDYLSYSKDAQNNLIRNIDASAVSPASTRKEETNKIIASSLHPTTGLSFIYYDSLGTPLSSPNEANAVEIKITVVNQKIFLGKTNTITQEKRILLRNK